MSDVIYTVLLWSGAIGCGVMAGVYFAFSTFVMKALGAIAPEAGMSATQSINRVIMRSPFVPLFFGTTWIAAAAVVLAARDWSAPASALLMAAGLVYIVGMFASTVVLNVPLNDELAAPDPASQEGQAVWARYVGIWTARNHIRTAASTIACGLFIAVLLSR